MKANSKALALWCISVVLIIAAGMAKFVSFSASARLLNDFVVQIPKSLQVLLGIGMFDLSRAGGYYAVLFLYLQLMTAVHASMLGANIISREERDKTSEFLLSKPVSRSGIITSKLAAALVNIIIINFITLAASLAIVGKYSQGEAVSGEILVLMAGMLVLQLIFLAIGTSVAAVGKKPKNAVSSASAILLFTFILAVLTNLMSNVDILKYITPFRYFDAKTLISGPGFEPVFLILSAVIIAALFLATYIFYNRRDISI